MGAPLRRKGRNIFTCVRRQFGDMYCAFSKIEIIDGKPTHVGCLRGYKDEYNQIPEHNKDGTIIHNALNSDPYMFGGDIIWESERSGGENGLSFTPEDEKGIMIRRAEDIHPLLHTVEDHRPYRYQLDDDIVAEVVGNSCDLFLTSKGWMEAKTYRKNRFEPCTPTIYGKWDKKLEMILPKCLRNYSDDIKGWHVITHSVQHKPRTIHLCDDPIAKICSFCKSWFKDENTCKRIVDIIRAIRKGEYINLFEALMNNGLSKNEAYKFMQCVSVKSKKHIYTTINLLWYRRYYETIGVLKICKEAKIKLKRNLINYIVNYPKFDTVLKNIEFKTDERYWDLYLLIKRAYKEGIIEKNMKATFPSWLNEIIAASVKSEEKFLLFGETYTSKTAPKTAKEDHLDAILTRVPRKEPSRLYPAMELVHIVLDVDKTDKTYNEFINIVTAGKFWNKTELKLTWKEFKHAYNKRKPQLFWNFIENIIEADKSTNNLTEGELTANRAFAENLISLRKNRSSFEVSQHRPNAKWNILVSKAKSNSGIYPRDIAWVTLLALGGLSNDCLENDQIDKDELVLHGTEIDFEDLCNLTVISENGEEYEIRN